MNEAINIWNILHDGKILGIAGSIPGDINISVAIPYLASRFDGQQTPFKIVLINCTYLSLEIWGQEIRTSDFNLILAEAPEILSTQSLVFPINIMTTKGNLSLTYDSLQVFLASGETLSYQDLDKASNQYWDEWEKQAKDKKG